MSQINGTNGNDFLNGTSGADTINGFDGDDVINAFAGNDVVDGGAGNDIIRGGDGDDIIDGGSGDDNLRGEGGNDQLIGGDGSDFFRGGPGIDSFDGGSEDPLSTTFGDGSFGDRISFFEVTATQGVVADLRDGIISNDGFGNVETMTGIESLGGDTAFADTFHGNDSRNLLLGSLGDTLMGYGGDDAFQLSGAPALIDGGDGIDQVNLITSGYLLPDSNGDGVAENSPAMTVGWQVNLFTGNVTDGFGNVGSILNVENLNGTELGDSLIGGGANNRFDGGEGDDTLIGGGGADHLIGGEGNDILIGGISAFSGPQPGDGADHLEGGAGNDLLRGGDGDDVLEGGDGDDNLRGDAGSDTLDGGAGIDFVSYLFITHHTGIFFDARSFGSTSSFSVVDPLGGIDTVSNVEKIGIAGTEFNDVIRGSLHFAPPSGFANQLAGNGGNDFITGGNSRDYIDGGSGDDSLRGEGGNDQLIGGDGSDFFRGGPGIDSFDGGSEDPLSTTFGAYSFGDRISFFEVTATQGVIADLRTGIISNDGFGNVETMTGIEGLGGDTAYADTFHGNDSRNLLLGSLGDTLMGYGGDDAFQLSGAAAVLDGGDGIDDVLLITAGYLIPDNNGDGVAENSPAMTAGWQVNLATGNVTDGFGNVGSILNVENLFGTELGDTLIGNDADNRLDGGMGDDTLVGNGGADHLIGGGGNDTLDGATGDDTAYFHVPAGTPGSFSLETGSGVDAGKSFVVLSNGPGSERIAEITVSGSTLTVKGINTGTVFGTDTVNNIQHLVFAAAPALPSDPLAGPGALSLDVGDVTGIVSDGYLAGATVFADSNGNGQQDPGEAATVTDANGNFQLFVVGGVPLVALGGVNTDTGLANKVALTAPVGASVINPLTTLVQAMVIQGAGSIDAATAEAQVKATLGLDANLNLLTADLIAMAATGDAAALNAQKSAAIIAVLITAAADLSGASGAADAVDALASQIAAAATVSDTVDLTDAALVEQVLETAAPGAGDLSTVAGALTTTLEAIATAESLEDLADGQATALLTGNDLDNVLTGGSQDDTLSGAGGNDRLIGGDGVDRMTGGSGADTFVGEINTTKVASKEGLISLDLILDFQSGVDKIDLSALDANTGVAGDQAFNFVKNASSNRAGDLWIKTFGNMNAAENSLGMEIDGVAGASPFPGKVTVVFGNIDGNAPDFVLVLIGGPTISSSDFIL